MDEFGDSEIFSRMVKTYKVSNDYVIFAMDGLIKEKHDLENKKERKWKCVCCSKLYKIV